MLENLKSHIFFFKGFYCKILQVLTEDSKMENVGEDKPVITANQEDSQGEKKVGQSKFYDVPQELDCDANDASKTDEYIDDGKDTHSFIWSLQKQLLNLHQIFCSQVYF